MKLKDKRERRNITIKKHDKYYNQHEFLKALRYFETNPRLVASKLEVYLKAYPHDKFAQCCYIDSLLCIRDFDKAKTLIENFDIYDSKITMDDERLFYLERKLNYIKAKLYSHLKEYDKAVEIMSSAIPDGHYDKEKCIFYCKFMTGVDETSESDTYIYSQIRNYSEKDFKEHIKKHIAEHFCGNINHAAIFADDFPIDEVIEELKRIIPNNMDKSFFSGIFDDTYYFKYDNCGRNNARYTDYIKVVTIHDTANFITMVPCSEDAIEYSIDLNYLRKDHSVHSLKKNSQIEKFNRRYNL